MIDTDCTDEEAGIWTWSLETDTLYADTAVASLFGLDPDKTVSGLSINAYVERVHPEDRASLASLISKAVKDGLPYHAVYRVIDAYESARPVMAFGRCFRDAQGNPTQYAGIVHPVGES